MKKINNTSKRNNLIKSLIIVALIFLVMGLGLKPLLNDLKFGLDLQGGFEILYQVEGANGEKVTSSMVTSTYKTIERRINGLGVSEPEIIVEGENIRVQLPGVKDSATARKTLSSVATLSFRDSSDNLLMGSDVLVSGQAKVSQDDQGRPAVALSVKDKETFYNVTKKISETEDKLIVIWLDYNSATDSYKTEALKSNNTNGKEGCGTNGSNCLSAATVSQGFASDVIIQGNFTTEEVENLVTLINSGSLPTKLTELSSKNVSASFGEDSLSLTAKAGVVGISAIILLLIIMYHFAGVIASIGLLIYTFLTILAFWLFGGVLTLPGIAALVIGVGMAIDSSVITFARVKDELKNNTSLEGAIKKGNKNSITSILDSNITTLLVAIILFIFGESSVKGFATMLIISTIVTMLVMVLLTRSLLGLFVKTEMFDKKLNFFIGFKKAKKERKKIDFIKLRKFAYTYIAVIVVVGVFTIFNNGLTLGIDFRGGSSISISNETGLTGEVIKKDVETLGYTVYDVEQVNEKNVIVKINENLKEDKVNEAEEFFESKYEARTDIGVISNVVKKELVKNAIISVILACIGIIIYVGLRFNFNFAFSGIAALVHDVSLIVILFSLLKLEVSSIFIAALLSIIGYSINDTIVSFDRIRELLRKKGTVKNREELKDIANESLNQVLSRSITTTVTTLMPVIALIFLGAHEIYNFNIALFIGLLAGTISSLFIAAPIWYDLEKHVIGKPKKKKWYE